MIFVGIESTCDETGCAVVREGKEILSNVVSSQIDLHNTFGGVVPELACRRHIEVIVPVLDEAVKKAGISLEKIDGVAVARGPGLIGAILIGLNFAKSIALALNKPFIGVNHVEAHLYAALMASSKEVTFPALGVVLSGGHTALVLMHDIGTYTLIGQTVDDAIGEAFDKVAKILGLRYPGGPEVEKLAKEGDPTRFSFSSGRVKGKPYAFSFSGLKTAVLYAVKGQSASYSSEQLIQEEEKKDVAAAFQQAAFQDIVKKTLAAAKEYGCHTLVFGGGVCNNKELRRLFDEATQEKTLLWPTAELTLDNAAMIAGLGYQKYIHHGSDPLDIEARTRMEWVK